MRKTVLLLLCVYVTSGLGKPLALFDSQSVEKNDLYKDTEEILNDWNNDDTYYDYSEEAHEGPIITYLPPVLVELEMPAATTTTTSTTTTTRRPVYFPNTDIDLVPIFDQVGKARRNEVEEPIDLPVPYIVWTQDPSGKEDKVNYWQRFYNSMYKVD